MRWQIQCARGIALAALPLQSQLRALKRAVTGTKGDPANEPGCIADGELLIEMVGRRRIAGASVFELGSGWQALIPLLFKHAGASQVTMTDDKPLMDAAYFERAKATLGAHGYTVNAGWNEFRYLAPCDWSMIPANSVDIIWSRAVLEHIPPKIIAGLFTEFRRILKPGGVMAHIIDNSDHWEHKDKSISRVNFLKFGDLTWRLITRNPLDYTNRLRHSDYRRMIADAGFQIADETGDICSRTFAALSGLRLAPQFQGRDPLDLATLTSRFLARPLLDN